MIKSKNQKYLEILKHYKDLINKYGKNNKGLGWNSKKKNLIRFGIIFNSLIYIKKKKIKVLDFGSGLSDLHVFFLKKKIKHQYFGIDTSIDAINFSKKKFPYNKYFFIDILKEKLDRKIISDLVVMNGIFTIKKKLTDKLMYNYIFNILKKIKSFNSKVIVFNLLTPNPDWKNRQNFYPSIDKVLKIIKKLYNLNVIIIYEKKIHEVFLIIKKNERN